MEHLNIRPVTEVSVVFFNHSCSVGQKVLPGCFEANLTPEVACTWFRHLSRECHSMTPCAASIKPGLHVDLDVYYLINTP